MDKIRSGESVKREYEAPEVLVLGSLHELTLWEPCNKDFGSTDGFTFGPQAQPIVCVST